MKKVSVAIYSGDIPSSTFIERLILGLPGDKYEILLFGNKLRDITYPSNIKIYPVPNGRLTTFFYLLVNIFKLAVAKPSDIGKLISTVRKYNGWRFRYLVKLLPILIYRPTIFHIQWVKSLQDLLILKTVFNTKLCVSLRGSHINYSPVLDPSLVKVYTDAFDKIDGFHAVSETIKNKSLAYGADSKKIQVIHSGLKEELFKNELDYKKYTHRNTIQIIAVGRNHWVKGYNYLIDALAICKKNNIAFHFTLIGGNISDDMKFQIHQQNLTSDITIINSLTNQEVLKKVSESHLLICSSVDEGISNSVLEAMAIGTVVISTDCGGMHEVIRNNENGFLVPKRDPQKMFEAISEFLKKDISDVRLMVQKGRDTIVSDFNENKMISEFDQLYNNILSS